MSRVLWICNIMLPAVGQALNIPCSSREGWLSGIFDRVQGREAPFELGVCFPVDRETMGSIPGHMLGMEGKGTGRAKRLSVPGVVCYAFQEDLSAPENYPEGLEEALRGIMGDFGPDMIHIFGTEFPHALAAVRAFGNSARTLIGIQGLCSEIGKVYMADLPQRVQDRMTFRDWIRRDSIRQQQEKFVRRGENEARALKGCGNITGRTSFDREGTAGICPGARYYHMNETLRGEFYTGKWELGACEEHSIFLGQGDYPLKGMHFVLGAMRLLLPGYPDLKLYVAGNSVIGRRSFKEKLKLSSYGKYLLELIDRYDLEDRVISMGKLNAPQMKQQFLRSSVFVCPSVLENSPNTVGEAQLLGVPVAASRAGGIPDMITHEKDGLLFTAGDESGLAGALEALWDRTADEEGLCLAQRISGAARERARKTHDGEKNYQRLLEIYREICTE